MLNAHPCGSWWSASANTNNANNVNYVTTAGSTTNNNANNANGVRPDCATLFIAE